MKVDEAFPSRFVQGTELPSDGVKVTIRSVDRETMRRPGAGEIEGFILWVVGAKKGIVLTAALARQLAGIIGDSEMDNWQGHQVILYTESLVVAGRLCHPIRARAVNP